MDQAKFALSHYFQHQYILRQQAKDKKEIAPKSSN